MKCALCGVEEAKYPDSAPKYCKRCWEDISKDERDRIITKSGKDVDTEHEIEDEETGVDTDAES